MSNASSGGEVTVGLHIRGRVQAVGYRAWCVHKARSLGLRGWVRNVTDGSVEALVCGSEDAIGGLIAAAHAGPPLARVTEVQRVAVGAADVAGIPSGFEHAPTANPGSR